MENISILYPTGYSEGYRQLSDVTIHDLGLDETVKRLSVKETEQRLVLKVLSSMSCDSAVAKYRSDVFEDIYNNTKLQTEMMEILERVDFLKSYGSFKREYDESASAWELLHRLDEIRDYISCVEAIHSCLSEANIKSKGLIDLKEYVNKIYHENGFEELKKDINGLSATTDSLKSVTLGVNLNDRFEAESIGVVSINSKPFVKSNLISNFYDKISAKDNISVSTEWDEDYTYQPFTAEGPGIEHTLRRVSGMQIAMMHPLTIGLAAVPDNDSVSDVTRYMDKITNRMLTLTVKKLKEVLKKYVSITITDMTNLIPEFIYYIRWAEYLKKLKEAGLNFCKPVVIDEGENGCQMMAKGLYNMKLISVVTDEHEEIVPNDIMFDSEHRVYLLTGANRGGKTTITQAVGQAFVLAQGGVYVMGNSFEYSPVDAVFTHFPADEDKTLDLGRLGEECKRFKDMYFEATKNSLLLLNETFSTTSFEEGYYIAKDSVKAILNKGIRTIYNTHMHKLAYDIDEINDEKYDCKAASLVVKSEEGKRSFKVVLAEPEGLSYANDIAVKYGVTYDMLTGNIAN